VRAVRLEKITVALGYPLLNLSCRRSELVDLCASVFFLPFNRLIACSETGQALDGCDLGKDWPKLWHEILGTHHQAANIEHMPTPPPDPVELDNQGNGCESAWDPHSRTPEVEGVCLPVESQLSYGVYYNLLVQQILTFHARRPRNVSP
jgi:hypothetical protein